TCVAKLSQGCPQGGVLSPLLWCLVVDELLCSLNNLGIYTQGYADDLAVMIIGYDNMTVASLMQLAMEKIEAWCSAHELNVNPKKTTAVVFTRRRNLEGLTALKIFGEEISLKQQVRYLGVTLDSKLTWNDHIDNITRKAKNSFYLCRSSLGQTWGLKPKTVYWLYTTIIRPAITYA